ncbi:MAG: GNAT family N-acetyltransferase [Thermomicrobiales bacterium]|nr:GNAT family N-acetyltransferase [Thermomicrobiales bacterium]
MPIIIRSLTSADSTACDAINRSLPDWFGIEEGLAEARGYLHTHRGVVAEIDGSVVGYLTYDQPFPESAEISWMAVAGSHHRAGIGRALVNRLEEVLRADGCELLSVKTLADLHPSPEYAQTRAFYRALGFRRLMVLPDLWDPSNPCLIMAKALM